MAERIVDRRVEKTKSALKDALVILLQDHPLESVGVQEILDRANVGRSTFYFHYQSKYELLHDCFQDFSGLLDGDRNQLHRPNGDDFLLDLFCFVDQNRALVKAFLGKDGVALISPPIEEYLHARIKLSLVKHSIKQRSTPTDLVAHCLVCELVGTLRWWLYSGADYKAEEIHRYFQRIAFGGVKEALGIDITHMYHA